MSGWDDYYPAGTWGGDPRAPWNAPDPPECLNRDCCATLEDDWGWCPYCGWHIDWDEVKRVMSE